MTIAAVILAAGGSTRLGSPKQLLEYRSRSLLRHAAETVLATRCRPVVVVLGSGADRLRDELSGLEVHLVDNQDWNKGMGTSIRRGIETLGTLAPEAEGALLMLCDQPLIRPEMLESLVQALLEGQPSCQAVAAAYEGTRGVPVVFGRVLLSEMAFLPDEAGAKSLLRRRGAEIIEVPMPEAATDIDTRAQYEGLRF